MANDTNVTTNSMFCDVASPPLKICFQQDLTHSLLSREWRGNLWWNFRAYDWLDATIGQVTFFTRWRLSCESYLLFFVICLPGPESLALLALSSSEIEVHFGAPVDGGEVIFYEAIVLNNGSNNGSCMASANETQLVCSIGQLTPGMAHTITGRGCIESDGEIIDGAPLEKTIWLSGAPSDSVVRMFCKPFQPKQVFAYFTAEDGLNIGLIAGLAVAAIAMLTVATTLLAVFRHNLNGWTNVDDCD